ncbi:MAG: hypothetical protein AAF206_16120 [Bacteroidota bacterium]
MFLLHWLPGLSNRNEKNRRWLVRALPVIGLLEYQFFSLWFLIRFHLDSWMYAGLGLTTSLLIFLGIRQIYQTEMMKRFFAMDNPANQLSQQQLDNLVDEIGQQRPE